MKNKLFTFAGALAALAILGHVYAQPLLAQVRAALVKNIDEHGRTPYQQFVFCQPAGPSFCQAVLPAVASHSRLVIEYVSADIDSTTPPRMNLVNNTPFQVWYFNAVPFGPTTQAEYVVAQPMTAFFEAGQTPSFGVSGSNPSAAVMISGYLVDLSQ
jgi:hypothetical protein